MGEDRDVPAVGYLGLYILDAGSATSREMCHPGKDWSAEIGAPRSGGHLEGVAWPVGPSNYPDNIAVLYQDYWALDGAVFIDVLPTPPRLSRR
jgi:hypothetical protein